MSSEPSHLNKWHSYMQCKHHHKAAGLCQQLNELHTDLIFPPSPCEAEGYDTNTGPHAHTSPVHHGEKHSSSHTHTHSLTGNGKVLSVASPMSMWISTHTQA